MMVCNLVKSRICDFCRERVILDSCGRCGSESCRICLTRGSTDGALCPPCLEVEELMVEAKIQAHRDRGMP